MFLVSFLIRFKQEPIFDGRQSLWRDIAAILYLYLLFFISSDQTQSVQYQRALSVILPLRFHEVEKTHGSDSTNSTLTKVCFIGGADRETTTKAFPLISPRIVSMGQSTFLGSSFLSRVPYRLEIPSQIKFLEGRSVAGNSSVIGKHSTRTKISCFAAIEFYIRRKKRNYEETRVKSFSNRADISDSTLMTLCL